MSYYNKITNCQINRPLPLFKLQSWQFVDNIHRLNRDVDDGKQEVEDVAGLVVLTRPVVGVVGDAALGVMVNGIAFQEGLGEAKHAEKDENIVPDATFNTYKLG